MGNLTYRTTFHRSFDEEFGPHQGTSEWWYATGYGSDAAGDLFTWQFTIIRPVLGPLRPVVVQIAVTDIAAGKHHYSQAVVPPGQLSASSTHAQGGRQARVQRVGNEFALHADAGAFGFDLTTTGGKPPVWHCDDGVLQMGVLDADQTTLYFSWTNLPSSGTLRLGDRRITVTGSTWFDKQGGTYQITDVRTHWEWFSLRFFDDTEAMLFTFPQSHYQDGTLVPATGPARRLTDYTVTPHGTVRAGGFTFSRGWTVDLPDLGRLEVRPLTDGQLNLAYFEQIAGIYADETLVGYAFVEVLPGVRNARINPFTILQPHRGDGGSVTTS